MFQLLDLSRIPLSANGEFIYATFVEKLVGKMGKKFNLVKKDISDELFQIGYEINKRQIPINEIRNKYADEND